MFSSAFSRMEVGESQNSDTEIEKSSSLTENVDELNNSESSFFTCMDYTNNSPVQYVKSLGEERKCSFRYGWSYFIKII